MVPQDSGWQPLSQVIDVTGVWRGRGRLGERKGKGPLWTGRWIQTWKIQKFVKKIIYIPTSSILRVMYFMLLEKEVFLSI